MIIDDVIITITAGKGGNGMVRFNKTKMSLGPTGSNGGKGGDIFIEGVSDLGALRQFRFKKDITAEKGQDGKIKLNDGKSGKNLTLQIPVGTVIHNLDTKQDIEIIKIDQTELVAKGGKGGRGNFLFRSSTNTTPTQSEKGKMGESFRLRLELKMIADIGLIGLPNVGKSSLLNSLTNANSKVANYPFTTLEPNLGVYYDLILADIPGIIEGAAMGKGLGIKFLKHIERTKVLFHLISAESSNPIQDYKTVRAELEAYNPLLSKKTEYIFLSKSDEASKDNILKIIQSFKNIKKEIIPISIANDKSIQTVKKILTAIIKEKTVSI
jgi:GTP-binding protein